MIPASILTAPVDSALRGIDLDDASHVSLLPLVRQVGLMLAEKLIALDELELAQGILERSVALIPEAKGDIARVIQPLLDELAQFEREPPDSVAQKRRKERLAAIGLFAVSAELEVVPDAASDQAELGQSPKGIVNPVPVQHASHRRYGFRAVLGFGLVSFLVIAYFTVDPLAIIYDRQADVDVNVAMPYKVARLSGETEGPAMQLPELTRAAGVNDLDLILYEMDRAGKKGNGQSYNAVEQIAGVDKDPRLTAVVKSKQADGVTPKAESRVPQRKLAKRLESINTKLPLEGTRFRPPAVKRNPGPGANDGLYQSDVRDVDVRDFGKRDRSAKSKPKPVRSGNIYRIITRTSVMARPSYRALTLAVLQPGAHIEVTNRVDEWLAIRSQQGRSGYVLRQDAEVLP